MSNVYDARLVHPTPEEWQKLVDENLQLKIIIQELKDEIKSLRDNAQEQLPTEEA